MQPKQTGVRSWDWTEWILQEHVSWCNVGDGLLPLESSLCEKDPVVSALSVSLPTLGDLKQCQRRVGMLGCAEHAICQLDCKIHFIPLDPDNSASQAYKSSLRVYHLLLLLYSFFRNEKWMKRADFVENKQNQLTDTSPGSATTPTDVLVCSCLF